MVGSVGACSWSGEYREILAGGLAGWLAIVLSSVAPQALGLHLPDPPLESDDEEEAGAAALSSHSSIPMDPGRRPPVPKG